jgi:hypothetical protein
MGSICTSRHSVEYRELGFSHMNVSGDSIQPITDPLQNQKEKKTHLKKFSKSHHELYICIIYPNDNLRKFKYYKYTL